MTQAFGIAVAAAASVLLVAAAGPAAAQDATDVRCFVAANIFTKAGDDKSKAAAQNAGFFYLGRLRGTPAQIETAIAAQARTLNPQNAGTVMQACAQAVEVKAQELQTIGQRLGQAQAARKAPSKK